ncbi:MAG: succinate--CoA ligase subunit alpha [Candidatus Eremiobacteraeota bacterium]|nr:succinate--CoA ligase subunit alpha [Candidatus Eremiobacteraeota bacterium]MBV8284659.1 succinate--CoA ligase subunit alpha [Candidatus Eremiobacteraeota bacterium]MBV8332301.1 succinate--CoA ligase subunit alpha [Candidatus Eremiobacteraeota bacterium]MBV8434749.1 succinate--CoA ligase subunit alpha [Candidatus Eremiobacteraeota bacterium]MBV8722970.1 succinate--CoA ligase subunit alpha [Candidatus Eremiobacteraeota bacterium]
MSIFLDKNSKVIVQGITGAEGSYHTDRMVKYGTHVVGGVTPGKGGQKTPQGLPVFDTVKDAVEATGATHTCIFVPPPFAADALYEAYEAGITFAVCITEGVPVHDMLKVVGTTPGMRIIGPNCPGLVSPGKASIGIMPGHVFTPGKVGLISRSGTLTYEVVDLLTRAGIGQSTCIGIGGDPIIGTTFVDCLREFKNDPETTAVVVCGEIGGSDEEDAAAFISRHMPETPIVGFIGGRNAPPGKSLGHAGAIISGNFGTPQSKIAAFKAAGVPVADRPSDIPRLLAERLAVTV